jgi:hypothetical protein
MGPVPHRDGVEEWPGEEETMDEQDREWMAYIDSEVRAVCEAKGWGHQIRRKEAIRHKPVSASPIEDYEWKLIPSERGKLPDAPAGDFEGVYYVLSFDRPNGKFVVQHDTSHCGRMGPHWQVTTYSEIRPILMETGLISDPRKPDQLPAGWLRDHLQHLISRFGPNHFSAT